MGTKEIDELTETLARMWMNCDPNRGGIDPDQLAPMTLYSGGSNSITEEHVNPLGGKPNWHWFIPRAQASIRFLAENGYTVTKSTA